MTAKGNRIAVVDDGSDLAGLFSGALGSVGCKTRAFDNPVSAIKDISIHHSECRLVLTDWKMPILPGLN
jgi:DNA-binding NtrC family response regulator